MKKTTKPEANELTIIDVPVSQVDVHPINDRVDLDPTQIESLAESIVQDGQLTPCLVRPKDNGRYELIYGSRRFRAVKMAGIETLRVDVRELDNQAALELIGVENIHRRDFNPIELANYLDWLQTPEAQGGAGLDEQYVANRFGKSRSWVRHTRSFLKLPEFWRDLIAAEKLPTSLARYLVPHAKKVPVMRAIEASYSKTPDAWSHRETFIDQLQFIVHRFEKLQQANPGPIGGPNGRMVDSNRVAALSPVDVRSEYEDERDERQTLKLAEELDAVTEGVEAMPNVPLTDEQAKALLSKHWSDEEALRLIRKMITRRLSSLGKSDNDSERN